MDGYYFLWIILTGSCRFLYHRKLKNDVSYKLPCMFIDSLLPCPTGPIGLENIRVSLGFMVCNTHPSPWGRVVINVGPPCIIYYMCHNYYTKMGHLGASRQVAHNNVLHSVSVKASAKQGVLPMQHPFSNHNSSIEHDI